MINFPTDDDLNQLRSFKAPHCVTIYSPVIDPVGASNPNRIALKNLLREAEGALHAQNLTQEEIHRTLTPAKLLLENREFRPKRHEGLALFIHSRFFRYYHIPDHEIPSMLTVGKGFNMTPITRAMRRNHRYYVLALGHKNVQLYEGDHFTLRPVHVRGFPASLDSTLNIDELPKWRETHTVAPPSSRKGSEVSHGQYDVSQVDKALLEQFFRIIDHQLHYFLLTKREPLILAGVEYLIPIYRKINTYPYLSRRTISGNMEHEAPHTIIDKAWPIVHTERRR